MSVYPDRVLLGALNDLANKKPRWLPRSVNTRWRKLNRLGDMTMVFSLEGGGIPLLSSVHVPWLLIWETLSARLRKAPRTTMGRGFLNKGFADDETDCVNRRSFTLQNLDDMIAYISEESGGSRNPTVSVSCGPCLPYTLQFLVSYGGLTLVMKMYDFNVQFKAEMAWAVAEAAMIGHYCAARLGAPADRLVVTAYDCWLPRGGNLGRKDIGVAAYIKQPKLCFGRISKSASQCQSGDLFVSGYMRSTKSVCDISKSVCANSTNTMKRAMSLGGAELFRNWKTRRMGLSGDGC